MQSLKYRVLMVSEKVPILSFFSRKGKKLITLSLLNTCVKNQKQWYIHDLLDVFNNCAKFQPYWIRTRFSVKTI